MNRLSTETWLAGADGCPAGWVVAFVRPDLSAFRIRIIPRIADILTEPEQPAILAIDMPIGLPARAGPGGRAAERAVRPLLGKRQSSVFSVPSRAAVEEADYGEACRLAFATSDPPRKVSKQLFHITPKIREVDALLRADPSLAGRVFEAHPEVAFWRLNGERALEQPKKVKSRPHQPGLELRQKILVDSGLPADAAMEPPPKGAGRDDLIDAFACAVVATRLFDGRARPFPDPPPRDEHGLPMAIWA